jgi:hypothetical protein
MTDAAEDKGPGEDNETAEGEDELETIEVVTEATDEDGDVVVDDLIVEVDGEGHIVATDETTIIRTTRGDVLVDETFSVAGDDGTLHVVDEDMTVLEADDATVHSGEDAGSSGTS